jgi:fructose-bisphosphate aldolase class II
MAIATLKDVLQPALKDGYAVAGLVVLGWEDAMAYAQAAEAQQCPLILQAGPGCRAHTPLPILGKMFRYLAESASVPVVCHLDHGNHIDECHEAIDSGFTSVMYDGSRLSLAENIANTSAVVKIAQAAGVSTEGEIGFVGYAAGEASAGTDPEEAGIFATETDLDAMAISVGNVHLQQEKAAEIDREALAAIEAKTSIPLVIHGGSGVPADVRRELAKTSNICKFNIGTELRMAFGEALRTSVASTPERFDRLAILKETISPVQATAEQVLQNLRT